MDPTQRFTFSLFLFFISAFGLYGESCFPHEDTEYFTHHRCQGISDVAQREHQGHVRIRVLAGELGLFTSLDFRGHSKGTIGLPCCTTQRMSSMVSVTSSWGWEEWWRHLAMWRSNLYRAVGLPGDPWDFWNKIWKLKLTLPRPSLRLAWEGPLEYLEHHGTH